MVIRISRHGLTGCPSCTRHFHVDDVKTARCPFCGATLAGAAGNRDELKRSALGRTGAALAAGLLSLGLGAACIDAEQPESDAIDTTAPDTTVTPDIAEDAIPQPEYGMPMDIDEPPADVPVAPLDGMPAPDVTDDTGPTPADVSQGDDAQVQPLYGMPMDIVEPAEDVLPQPEYGMPMPDVSDGDKDAGPADTEAADIPIAPLYGLPPGQGE